LHGVPALRAIHDPENTELCGCGTAQTGKSARQDLNKVATEALARGAGVSGELVRQRDLRGVAGTWREDRAFDCAMADQDAIDREPWQ